MRFFLNRRKKQPNVIYICVTVLLICTFPSSFPQVVRGETDQWLLYYTAADGSRYFYDTKSIKMSSKIPSRTYGRNFRSPKYDKKAWLIKVREKIVARPDRELKEARILREFDCTDRKVRILTASKFHRNGNEEIEGRVGPWVDIESAISYETLYQVVCTH
jgi:hypothetical protein